MIKLVDRYIFKEIISPFLIGLLVFTFILFIDKIINLTEMVITRGIALSTVAQFYLYILPTFLTLTLPMALLLGVLVSFGRLSTDNEMMILRGAGWSLYRLSLPVLVFTLTIFSATLFINLKMVPPAYQNLRELLFNLARQKALFELKEGVFNEDFEDLVVFAHRIREGGAELEGILIADDRGGGETKIVTASEGKLIADPEKLKLFLRLKNGTIQQSGPDYNIFNQIEFATYDAVLSLEEKIKAPGTGVKKLQALSLSELYHQYTQSKTKGENYWPALLEIHRKFSIPSACLVFALLGIALAAPGGRGGKSQAFSLCLAILLIYYLLMITGEAFCSRNYLHPFWAAWNPNIVLGLVGIYLFYKQAREKPLSPFKRFKPSLRLEGRRSSHSNRSN